MTYTRAGSSAPRTSGASGVKNVSDAGGKRSSTRSSSRCTFQRRWSPPGGRHAAGHCARPARWSDTGAAARRLAPQQRLSWRCSELCSRALMCAPYDRSSTTRSPPSSAASTAADCATVAS